MSLKDFYEPFFVQEYVEVPPENQSDTGQKLFEYKDGKEIIGKFKQRQSTKIAVADSEGIFTKGRFASKADIISGSILRRVSDDKFIKILGVPLQSPSKARTQVRTWESYITSRNEEMKARYLQGSSYK